MKKYFTSKEFVCFFAYFCLGLSFLQLTSFWITNNGFATINDHMIFGLYGNNFLSGLLSLLFLIILYYLFFKDKKTRIIFSLVFAGTASNVLDRLVYGGVVDYIKILSFPIFNLADVFITIGLLCIVWTSLKIAKR
ncbi:MAG: signal peptidase II [Patescibacteria group bacterium]